MPFMYCGHPSCAPRSQYSTWVDWLSACRPPLTTMATSRNVALRMPAPGDLRMVATATPPG